MLNENNNTLHDCDFKVLTLNQLITTKPVRKVLLLFIGITCVIGCREAYIREPDIKEIAIRETGIEETKIEKPEIKETEVQEVKIKEADTKNSNDKQSNLYDETGFASFISDAYDGEMTASGTRYDKNKMTAAHPTLPFDTVISITNLRNNRNTEAVVIDRFRPAKGRIVNVSHRVAEELDLIDSGVAKVGIKIVADTDQNLN